VGASDGSADVSQVIAAIDWVSQHARDPGLNIRVLNLSYGTDGKQDYHSDPLAYAAQAAWRKGVLVVVAGGNDGTANAELANPASDGNLLAVGAEDPQGTLPVLDDTVPAFANRGTGSRHVDIVAPGVHILGVRVPNGLIDQSYPSARVGTRFFRGSGTSQATAVVSGAAALLFQRYPTLTPQQAKMILSYGATWLAKGTTTNAGAGVVNVASAMTLAASALTRALAATTTATFGTGKGSLERARGSAHVAMDGATLTGEKDIFGATWSASVNGAQGAGRRRLERRRGMERQLLDRCRLRRLRHQLGRAQLGRQLLDRHRLGRPELGRPVVGGEQLGRALLGRRHLAGTVLGRGRLVQRHLVVRMHRARLDVTGTGEGSIIGLVDAEGTRL
jgi:serine protease AprX